MRWPQQRPEHYGLADAVELHGHEIFHATGARVGVPVGARVGVFDDVVEAVSGQEVKIIARAMDVVGQRARYHKPHPPHSIVLQHLLERIDECVTMSGDYALVITDEVDGQVKHRTDFSNYRDVGTKGYRRCKLTRIVDTLHFASVTPADLSRPPTSSRSSIGEYSRTTRTDERSRKARTKSKGSKASKAETYRRCTKGPLSGP